MEKSGTRGSALQTVFDVIIAPRAAFAQLAQAPTWVWAFAVSSALGIIAALAITPIVAHVLSGELPARLAATPEIARLPADQRDTVIAQQVGITQAIARYSFVFVPFGLAIGSALQALVMFIGNAIGKGRGTFKSLWALAVNSAIVGTGVASVALLAIVLIRGPDGFASSSEISSALPGLGTFVPPGAKTATAFFGVMNVFAIWNMVLLAVGMTIVARLPRTVASVTAAILFVGTGLFPLAGALLQK